MINQQEMHLIERAKYTMLHARSITGYNTGCAYNLSMTEFYLYFDNTVLFAIFVFHARITCLRGIPRT